MKTSFRTLLWDAPEEEYRTTGIHYSDISNYLTVGFQRSYEKEDISSSSLRIGSAVDTILTMVVKRHLMSNIICPLRQ